jgi:AraC-like DNA-binding protein
MGQRIDQFREDLRHMSDIALSCQFSSHASFNRAFRRAIGVTPGEIPSG